MSKLYLPIGLIGTGKSTWAKAFVKTHPNTKIVAGDDIRYMLNGGVYQHDPELEPIVLEILFVTARTLLQQGYDVILDECYCSLSVRIRENVVMNFEKVMITAVVFPEKDMKDHIEDKVTKGLRGKSVGYWKRVFRAMKIIYEPFNIVKEHYFTYVIEIKE